MALAFSVSNPTTFCPKKDLDRPVTTTVGAADNPAVILLDPDIERGVAMKLYGQYRCAIESSDSRPEG